MTAKSRISILPMPLFSGYGLFVLGAALVIPIIGIVLNMALAATVGLLLCYLAVCAWYLIRNYAAVRGVLTEMLLSFDPSAVVYSGVESEMRLSVDIPSSDRRMLLKLKPLMPQELQPTDEVLSALIDPAQKHLQLSYGFRALARGEKFIEGIFGRVLTNPLVWWQFFYRFPIPLAVTVYPNHNFGGTRDNHGFQRHSVGENFIDVSAGQGREFDSLRRYTPGDCLRRVDWKRSARGRGLLVKVYRPETHQRIHVALDCGRRMGNVLNGRLQLEHAADAASYLVHLAHANGDEAGFFAFHHQVVSEIRCARGSRQVKRIVNAICQLEMGSHESDYQLLSEWAHLNSKRSLLVLITSLSNPAGLDQIGASLSSVRRKHLPLVFCIADRDLRELNRERAESLDDAYIIAAAGEQIAAIEAHRRLWERSGIGCIYCDAESLQRELELKYFELKRSGRL